MPAISLAPHADKDFPEVEFWKVGQSYASENL